MWRHFLLVMAVAVSLGACTPLDARQTLETQRSVYPPAAFSHRVGTTQVVLYWNCLRPDTGVLRMDGVAHSPYFSAVRSLEFELVGVDANDRIVSEAKGATRDYVLRTNQVSPFQLDVTAVGSEVRFDLYYHYRSQENLRSQGNLGTIVAGPLMGGRILLVQATNRFLARDVCSETQHRIPQPAR